MFSLGRPLLNERPAHGWCGVSSCARRSCIVLSGLDCPRHQYDSPSISCPSSRVVLPGSSPRPACPTRRKDLREAHAWLTCQIGSGTESSSLSLTLLLFSLSSAHDKKQIFLPRSGPLGYLQFATRFFYSFFFLYTRVSMFSFKDLYRIRFMIYFFRSRCKVYQSTIKDIPSCF